MADSATAAIVDRLAEFAHELRRNDIPVGTDDLMACCAGLATLAPSDPEDVYWAGRSTLVHRREHLAVYDEVFRQFFLHLPPPPEPNAAPERPVPQGSTGTIQIPDSEPGDEQGDDRPMVLGVHASGVAIERDKRFSACTPDELAAVRRIIARTRLQPPQRTTRRRCPDPSGPTLDIRRMARDQMRMGDAAEPLRRTDRKRRARPLVLILDVSGSMADHSRNLLQFAYSMRRAAQRVEVFCFGTRLTRITPALDRRHPDDAMRLAAERVVDWDGGTRIGDSLDAFVRNWGRRGLSRGATVVVCSDGYDRGDPVTLADAIERLARLCHRLVWMNPLQAPDDETTPSTLGMFVAAPFVDEIVSGRDLESLERFAEQLPKIG